MLIAFILTISLSVVKVYLYNIVNMMEYDESPSKYNIHIAGRNSFHAAIFQLKFVISKFKKVAYKMIQIKPCSTYVNIKLICLIIPKI